MPAAKPKQPSPEAYYQLLGFFFPIHYPIGMELERKSLQGSISRQHAAILWLLQHETNGHGHIRRKRIEQALNDWFETKNSHVSHLLKELSAPNFGFVEQISNPESGREKLVGLTDAGRTFFNSMLAEGVAFFTERLSHLTERELQDGMKFLRKAFGPATQLP